MAEEKTFADKIFESTNYEWDPTIDEEAALRDFYGDSPIGETIRTREGRNMLRDHVRKQKNMDSLTRAHIQLALRLHQKRQKEKRKREAEEPVTDPKKQCT